MSWKPSEDTSQELTVVPNGAGGQARRRLRTGCGILQMKGMGGPGKSSFDGAVVTCAWSLKHPYDSSDLAEERGD